MKESPRPPRTFLDVVDVVAGIVIPPLPKLHPAGLRSPPLRPVPRGFSPRGCKGRSPLHEITLSLPLPAGKGVGGMGEKKKAKGRVCRRQGRQAPPPATGTPPRPHSARGSAPRRVPAPPLQPVPPGFSPRGCKGRSPLHKITLSLPLPRRGRG